MSDWKNVQYKDGKMRTSESGGGGSSTLAGLDDVDLDNLQDGQIIKWDATNEKFVNANESGGSSIHMYSTTEQVVAKWIDGSDIYEITLTGGSIATNSQLVVDVTSLNIKTFIGVNSDGTYIERADFANCQIPLNYNVPTNALYGWSVGRYGNELFINTGSFGITSYYLTIRYIKNIN